MFGIAILPGQESNPVDRFVPGESVAEPLTKKQRRRQRVKENRKARKEAAKREQSPAIQQLRIVRERQARELAALESEIAGIVPLIDWRAVNECRELWREFLAHNKIAKANPLRDLVTNQLVDGRLIVRHLRVTMRQIKFTNPIGRQPAMPAVKQPRFIDLVERVASPAMKSNPRQTNPVAWRTIVLFRYSELDPAQQGELFGSPDLQAWIDYRLKTRAWLKKLLLINASTHAAMRRARGYALADKRLIKEWAFDRPATKKRYTNAEKILNAAFDNATSVGQAKERLATQREWLKTTLTAKARVEGRIERLLGEPLTPASTDELTELEPKLIELRKAYDEQADWIRYLDGKLRTADDDLRLWAESVAGFARTK